MNVAGLLTYDHHNKAPSRLLSGIPLCYSHLQLRDSTGLAPVSLLNDESKDRRTHSKFDLWYKTIRI